MNYKNISIPRLDKTKIPQTNIKQESKTRNMRMENNPYSKNMQDVGANPEKYAKMVPNYIPKGAHVSSSISPQFYQQDGNYAYANIVNERISKQKQIYANQQAEQAISKQNKRNSWSRSCSYLTAKVSKN